MKIKTLGLIALLSIGCIILTGCNKDKDTETYCEGNNEGICSSEKKLNSTSFTSEELDKIAENNFPTSYIYTSFNKDDDKAIDNGSYTYPNNTSYTLLIPEHATMASREVTSSDVKNGMIYTNTKVTLQDDTEINVLYIIDSETSKFIAASVEKDGIITNYQFDY